MQSDGKAIGFWVTGMQVYGVCIFVANFELAIRFNTHTWLGCLTLLAGVVAYFFFYSILSFVFKGQIDHLFVPSFQISLVWVAIFFCIAQTYAIEKMYKYLYQKFSKIANRKNLMKQQFIEEQKNIELYKLCQASVNKGILINSKSSMLKRKSELDLNIRQS